MTKNVVTENAQMKNSKRNCNTMELYLTNEQVLCLGISISRELASSHQESETIGGILGNRGAKQLVAGL